MIRTTIMISTRVNPLRFLSISKYLPPALQSGTSAKKKSFTPNGNSMSRVMTSSVTRPWRD